MTDPRVSHGTPGGYTDRCVIPDCGRPLAPGSRCLCVEHQAEARKQSRVTYRQESIKRLVEKENRDAL